MTITVNNQDRTSDLGSRIRDGILSREHAPKPADISPEIGALRLADARSEAEYQELLLRLMRYRDNIDTLPFDIPRRPGLLGALMAGVRRFLWKLLRYQHDRMAARQNLINSTVSAAIEFEHRMMRDKIEELQKRIADLEERR